MMRKVASTENLELWMGSRIGMPAERTVMHHELSTMDKRGQLVVEFVKAWSHAQLISDGMKAAMDGAAAMVEGRTPERKKYPPEIGALVCLAADTVEAIYDEVDRRGWLLRAPSFFDDVNQDVGEK